MAGTLQPLDQKFAIVDQRGLPTEYFIRWAQQRQIDISGSITLEQAQQLIKDMALIVEDDSTDWGDGAVKTLVPFLTFGENSERGTVTFFAATSPTNIGGFEMDLKDFAGGAIVGDVMSGNRIVIGVYGSVTGWEFNADPYVNTFKIYHKGNLSFGTGLSYNAGTGVLTATGGGGASAPAIVQSGASVGNTSAVTLAAAPTAGNILVAIGTHWANSPTIGSRWIPIYSTNGAARDGLLAAYKMCGAAESATQTPFTTAGGATTAMWELSGAGGFPFMMDNFQESAGTVLNLYGYGAASALILGMYSQQASNVDFPITNGTLDQSVIGVTTNNSPRRIKSFHAAGAAAIAQFIATLPAAHDTAGLCLAIPGA